MRGAACIPGPDARVIVASASERSIAERQQRQCHCYPDANAEWSPFASRPQRVNNDDLSCGSAGADKNDKMAMADVFLLEDKRPGG
jgi:hypothetical protein